MQNRFIFSIFSFILLHSCVFSDNKDHTITEEALSTDGVASQSTYLTDTVSQPVPAMQENKNSVPSVKMLTLKPKKEIKELDLPPSALKKYPVTEVSKPRIKLDADTTMPKEVLLIVMQEDLYAKGLRDTIRVRMYNYTKDTLMTGLHHRVEFLNVSKWELIKRPARIVTVDIGYYLYPRHAQDFLIHLYPDFHNYKPGRYRIIKDCVLHDFPKTGENHELIATFELK